VSSHDFEPPHPDSAPERISIFRAGEAGRAFAERAARVAEEVMFSLEGAIAMTEKAVAAGEMSEDALQELRDLLTLLRQRALGTRPQGRLV
jgi:hypothetical protein